MAGAAVAVLVAVLGLTAAPQASTGVDGTFTLGAFDIFGTVAAKQSFPTTSWNLETTGGASTQAPSKSPSPWTRGPARPSQSSTTAATCTPSRAPFFRHLGLPVERHSAVQRRSIGPTQ
jgi:hypothetical protein